MTAQPACDDRVVAALRRLLGDRLSVSEAERANHGKDVSYLAGHPPDAVAYVQSTEEVAAVVELCAAHGVPVVPYGTGTSLEGHIAALE
ncbi:MAG: FAD-binding oxidoreductase, partial [Proteobacteria bacterium]|nr:FAD-binding oxidoreductase [Pseudomonadota bacterium]